MKRAIIGVIIVLAVFLGGGCATIPSPDDICVMTETGTTAERLCKSEAKTLPGDFPDHLFLEWFSSSPDVLQPIAWDKNGRVYEVAWLWGDSNGDVIAAMHMMTLPSGRYLAWAFVEFTPVAEIVWISQVAGKEQKKLLERLIENFNKKYQNKA